MNTSLRNRPLPSDITKEDLVAYCRVKAEMIGRDGEEGLGGRRSLEQIAALPDDGLITQAEAGRLLGTADGTLRDWVKKGIGPRVVVNGNWTRYRMGDIRQFLADKLVDTTSREDA